MNYQDLPDESLLGLLIAGDSKAFEAIYQRYWRKLFGFTYQLVGSKEDCEEIIHDLMTSLWQNRERSNIRNLQVYIFIAARNLSNKYIKSKIDFRKYLEYQLINEILDNGDAEKIISPRDLDFAIEKALKKMPEKTATIFRLSKMDNMPVKKIALQMHLTDKAVEYHITKSLKVLREQLRGFTSYN
ncbi:RNA polymerase sigma-70 factor, ECF subfamily [Dyadobacter soli]|uniref:RNA polymerase sigma-70 factor, ECF subfamily n=1 Tax=Dyadobacter soli TaxID=659014 RepID=A0A1G7T7V6_9BACT|nr:sigma-70 family RNA polymerase sigma factor [Dyadobacter soli]SDG30690.1 RNA polymerase sigma-70 factor, ECF subfamily [Dyadobacter soli]